MMNERVRNHTNMKDLRFAVVGAGFWAEPQLFGWGEVKGAAPIAICDLKRSKAESLAKKFAIPGVYDNAEEMLLKEKPNFIDVITNPESHEHIVFLTAKHNIPVICQKPMATTLELASQMVQACKETNTPFFVHENWRWQRPLRAVKKMLDSKKIGDVFRGRVTYSNNFPVFINQPFLKDLAQFMLTDMGTHILDVARFLFGEAETVYCQTASVTPGIKGEDVATINMKMKNNSQCNVEMSYATILEKDTFPQTFVLIEGEKGSIKLDSDYQVKTTTKEGTEKNRFPPKMYPWIDPAYALVQSSIVDANRNFLEALQGKTSCETTGEDNLKTLQLVFSAYESAKENKVIKV